MVVSWLRTWLPESRRAAKRANNGAARIGQCRLNLEPLEDRCLLSAPPVGMGPLATVTEGLTPAQVSGADAVVNWNATMLRAIWTNATPPTLASHVEAMVGTAVYDAVDGINPQYAFYSVPGLTGQPRCRARRTLRQPSPPRTPC